jgi:hypothetical protein
MVAEDIRILGRCSILLLAGEKEETHFGKVNGLKREFSESFTPVDIRLRGSSYTATTKLGANSVL